LKPLLGYFEWGVGLWCEFWTKMDIERSNQAEIRVMIVLGAISCVFANYYSTQSDKKHIAFWASFIIRFLKIVFERPHFFITGSQKLRRMPELLGEMFEPV